MESTGTVILPDLKVVEAPDGPTILLVREESHTAAGSIHQEPPVARGTERVGITIQQVVPVARGEVGRTTIPDPDEPVSTRRMSLEPGLQIAL